MTPARLDSIFFGEKHHKQIAAPPQQQNFSKPPFLYLIYKKIHNEISA